jgi:hypothetical protein
VTSYEDFYDDRVVQEKDTFFFSTASTMSQRKKTTIRYTTTVLPPRVGAFTRDSQRRHNKRWSAQEVPLVKVFATVGEKGIPHCARGCCRRDVVTNFQAIFPPRLERETQKTSFFVSLFYTDVKQWGQDMSTLPLGIQVWATLFPLPQLVLGAWSPVRIGPTSVGAWYTRLQSGIVAGQVHKKRPFHKLMGPLMHLPFLILVPYSMVWLLEDSKIRSGGSSSIIGKNSSHQANSILTATKIHYCFVLYTTCISAVSTAVDSVTFIKWMMGYDVEDYKRIEKKE